MRLSALTKSRLQKPYRYECVVLSAFASRWHDGLAGLAAAADRLTHASVRDEYRRHVQRRLSTLALLVVCLHGHRPVAPGRPLPVGGNLG